MAQHHDDTKNFVDAVEDYWSRHGMRSSDRRRLATELEQDLQGAIQGEVTSAEVLLDEPADFARSLASANGIELQEPRALSTGALVRNGLVGGLVAAAVAWLLVYRGPTYLLVSGVPGPWGIWLLHLVAALVTLGGVVAGMWWPFKHEPRIRSIVRIAGAMTALGGALSVAPIKLVAAMSNYSTAPLVVFIEIGVAAAFCGSAIVAATRIENHHLLARR